MLSESLPEPPSPYKRQKGTFTIFTDRSKIDRENYRYDKYKGKYQMTYFNPVTQQEEYDRLKKKFRMKEIKNKDPNIRTWKNVDLSSKYKLSW